MKDQQIEQMKHLCTPIVIGVTGHRDILDEDIPALTHAVSQFFKQLQDSYPHTKDSILVFSCLAEGSDRIVAKTALDFGCKVIVPLPFAVEEYKKDFTSEASMKEFDELLKKTHSFPIPLAEGNTMQNIRHDGEHRNQQYLEAGILVARNSHILLGLWDGKVSKSKGGTYDLLRLRFDGLPPSSNRSNMALRCMDRGPIYIIHTPHRKCPAPVGVAFTTREFFFSDYQRDEPKDPKSNEKQSQYLDFSEVIKFSKISHPELQNHGKSVFTHWREQDEYDLDTQRLAEKLSPFCLKSREYLFPEEKLPHPAISENTRRLREQFAMADSLALYFRERQRHALLAVCILSVFAIGLLAGVDTLGGAIFERKCGVLFGFILTSLLAFYLARKGRSDHQKYLNYRGMAEGCRIQFFWQLAGLGENVADHYLRKIRSEIDWIRQAIRAWSIDHELLSLESTHKSPDSNTTCKFLRTYWIDDQYNYFKSACQNHEKNLASKKRAARIVLRTGIGIAVIWLLLAVTEYVPFVKTEYNISLIAFTLTMVLTIVGTIHFYLERLALNMQAKQYGMMESVFSQAGEAIEAGKSNAEEVILELGKEALSENGDWIMLRRHLPIESRIG